MKKCNQKVTKVVSLVKWQKIYQVYHVPLISSTRTSQFVGGYKRILVIDFVIFAQDNAKPLKRQAKLIADGNLILFKNNFSENVGLDISSELSAWETIHMKCQVLISPKNKIIKYFKMSSAAVVIGALSVNMGITWL